MRGKRQDNFAGQEAGKCEEWVQNIQNQQSSGLTVKAWCATQGYGEGRFYYWLNLVRGLAIEQVEQAAQGASLTKVESERLPSATSSLSTAAGNARGIF